MYTIPTLRATDECKNPAIRPANTPNSPAIGAKVVDNKSVSIGAGSFIYHCFINADIHTPTITGSIFLICLPAGEKPTIVKIDPMVGPFKSPFAASTNAVAIIPFIDILKIYTASE